MRAYGPSSLNNACNMQQGQKGGCHFHFKRSCAQPAFAFVPLRPDRQRRESRLFHSASQPANLLLFCALSSELLYLLSAAEKPGCAAGSRISSAGCRAGGNKKYTGMSARQKPRLRAWLWMDMHRACRHSLRCKNYYMRGSECASTLLVHVFIRLIWPLHLLTQSVGRSESRQNIPLSACLSVTFARQDQEKLASPNPGGLIYGPDNLASHTNAHTMTYIRTRKIILFDNTHFKLNSNHCRMI